MKHRFLLFATAALLIVAAALWWFSKRDARSRIVATGMSRDDHSSGLNLTAAEATARAVAEIGLEKFDSSKTTTNVEVLTAESMPFLGEGLAGKKTWAIQFHDVHLPTHGPGGQLVDNPYVRDLDVVLAPDSGNVMSLISPWPAGEPPWDPYPPGPQAAQWTRDSARVYVDLPSQAPSCTLMQAMLADGTMCWSPLAKQIVVYYVVETRFADIDPTHYPIWAVHIRGFPALAHPGGYVPPAGTLDLITNEIDARTGRWLGAADYPKELLP